MKTTAFSSAARKRNGDRQGVLFVGHGASRTGAPIALLHFLRWFKENGNRPFSLLIDVGGELVKDYAGVADTWVAESSRWCPGGLRSQVLTALGLPSVARRAEKANIRSFAMRCPPALIYLNSIGSARVIEALSPHIPVLTHVHDLEFLLHVQAGAGLPGLFARTSRFIACSHAVKQNLVLNHGVDPGRIETVHETIPVQGVQARRGREEVLEELHVPKDALLVAASGTPDWRKGADLFVQLARLISRARPRAYFVWIGGGSEWEQLQVEQDVRQAELSGRVRFTGLVLEPTDYFAAADVFVLTSREDPYPLVCLEAAAVGKPIVCFANGGGMPEFVEEDCGYIVPYIDVAAMAQRLVALLDSADRRAVMGAAAQRKVRERHDISVAGPLFAEIIERTIAEASGKRQPCPR